MALEIASLAAVIETRGAAKGKRDLKALDRQGKKTGATFDKLKGAIAGIGVALVGMQLGRFLRGAISEAIAAERIWVGLRTTVENTGASFEDLAPQIQAATDALQATTSFAGDQGAAALSELTRILGDTDSALDALSVAADVAAATGLDLMKAAQFTGRVLAGETTILKRYGIVIGEGEDAMEGLRRAVGGFAEQEAQTMGGQLKQLTNAWDDFRRELGFALIDSVAGATIIDRLRMALEDATNWVQRNADVIAAWVDVVRRSFALVGRVVQLFGRAIKSTFDVVGQILGSIGALLVGIFTFDIGLIKQSVADAAEAFVTGFQPVRDVLQETAEDVVALAGALAAVLRGNVPQATPRGQSERVAGGGRGPQGGPTGGAGAGTGGGKTLSTPAGGTGKGLPDPWKTFIGDLAMQMEASIEETIGDAIFNGFQGAFSGKGLGEIFAGLGRTVLAGLGAMFVDIGRALISYGIVMTGLRVALLNIFTSGPAAIAAGAALIALGSTFTAIASGAGRGTAGAAAFREPRLPADATTRTITLGPNTTRMAPMAPVNITVIGPNDPRAQRAIMSMVRKAQRRGL